jgi:hypothetical protein
MGSAAGMLAEARKSLGMSGRPNTITRDYASRHGDEFLRAAWCDMAVTYWARRSGNAGAVLPGGDRAYTVWHAQDFQKADRWFTGTTANVNRARPGDIVFFDWGESNSVGAIDHVGVVEKALGGGRVQTIEGNTGDQCLRRVRSSTAIAGYGRPDYGAEETWDGRAPAATLRAGDTGTRVRDLQNALLRAEFQLPVYGADGDYGDETTAAVRALQRNAGLSETGIYDAATAAALQRALSGPQEGDDVPYFWGSVPSGKGEITPISLPGGVWKSIGFTVDNGLAKLPATRIRVAVHDARGWYAAKPELVLDSAAKEKVWFSVRDPKSADGISIQRLDDLNITVAWDAS